MRVLPGIPSQWRSPHMDHVVDRPSCACFQCRCLRFQYWREAVAADATVEWQNGRWVIISPWEWLDDLDGHRAA